MSPAEARIIAEKIARKEIRVFENEHGATFIEYDVPGDWSTHASVFDEDLKRKRAEFAARIVQHLTETKEG